MLAGYQHGGGVVQWTLRAFILCFTSINQSGPCIAASAAVDGRWVKGLKAIVERW